MDQTSKGVWMYTDNKLAKFHGNIPSLLQKVFFLGGGILF